MQSIKGNISLSVLWFLKYGQRENQLFLFLTDWREMRVTRARNLKLWFNHERLKSTDPNGLFRDLIHSFLWLHNYWELELSLSNLGSWRGKITRGCFAISWKPFHNIRNVGMFQQNQMPKLVLLLSNKWIQIMKSYLNKCFKFFKL